MSSPKVFWSPSQQQKDDSNLNQYSNWLRREKDLSFDDYKSLWQWSVDQPADFWESIWQYFDVINHSPYQQVMSDNAMPNTRWFEGATLNYAEHIFRRKTADRPALLFQSEKQELSSISWEKLEEDTAALQAYFKECGVEDGDVVASYLPNIPQATVSLLATLSLGGIWSSCSPDFGTKSVMDRFRQIEPKVLITADGYTYNGKEYDRSDIVTEIADALPSVEKVVWVPYLNNESEPKDIENSIRWDEVIQTSHGELTFTPVSFSHPIWVLYSSGTTGTPKAITHSHGGMLLEHLKYLTFHNDVKPGENFFWFSTTGWMMWNFVQASLLVGATAVLYDGSAGYPNLNGLWKLTEQAPIHHFGTSAPFILACKNAGLTPESDHDLNALRSIGSTGSPLPPEGFDYVYDEIKDDVWLGSMSGGTDVCTAWVGPCPWRNVYEGEIQSRCLGASMYAFDEAGEPLDDEVGEMAITKPMPCMPIYFWGDENKQRYRSSYFQKYPDVWRHGDWMKVTPQDGVIIKGRSDATLNRQGVRIGTAEVYRAVRKIDEVDDSIIVNLEQEDGSDFMPLFVIVQDDQPLTTEVKYKINQALQNEYSPRHVPDDIIKVQDIPYTLSGKKIEAPVKKILMGQPIDKAANKGAMKNPESLDFFAEYTESL